MRILLISVMKKAPLKWCPVSVLAMKMSALLSRTYQVTKQTLYFLLGLICTQICNKMQGLYW